jgi:hypothetical protein
MVPSKGRKMICLYIYLALLLNGIIYGKITKSIATFWLSFIPVVNLFPILVQLVDFSDFIENVKNKFVLNINTWIKK